MGHQSTKIFSGYSTAFRQWKATHSHCKFMHGYALSFKVWFEGDIDERNWVADFGSFKKNGIKDKLSNIFDHTTIVANDDPLLADFENLHKKGAIQIIIMEDVGCEIFAKCVSDMINIIISKETNGRVKVKRVECFEGSTNNSAMYEANNEIK